jgi:flagellar biosynthesis/type III secretory pathway chaperone
MQATGLKNLTQQLIDILGVELTVGHALLAAVQAERSAVIESKTELFSAATIEKEEQARRFKAAEAQRLTTIAQIAAVLHPAEDLRLEDIIKACDGASARSLRNCKIQLQQLLGRLQKENQANNTLLTHCYGLVNASLTMLKNLLFAKPTYVRSGQIQGIAEGGMLISSNI